jgi:hypothetical protein
MYDIEVMGSTYFFENGQLSVATWVGPARKPYGQLTPKAFSNERLTAVPEPTSPGECSESYAEFLQEFERQKLFCYRNWQRLPLVISASFTSLKEAKIFTILAHHLDNPSEARALTPVVVKRLPNILGSIAFVLTADDLNELLLDILAKAKEAVSGSADVELVGGMRRDKIRELMQ